MIALVLTLCLSYKGAMKTHIQLLSLFLAVCLLASSCAIPAVPDETAQEEKPVYELPAELEGIHVVAEDSDASGIGISSAFEITVPGGADIRFLESHISLSPETPFSLLNGKDGNTVRLLPQETLKPNLVYRVEALTADGRRARSWAFQTRAPLTIVGTTPENESYSAGTATGIEVLFNRENVDISNHFSIDPPVEGQFLTYGKRSAFAPAKPLQNDTAYTVTISAGLMAPDGSALPEDYSFRFRVEEDDAGKQNLPVAVYIDDDRAETFLSMDTPIIDVSVHNMKGSQPVEARVFAVSSGDYIKELAKRTGAKAFQNETALFPTDGLTPQLAFSKVMVPETYHYEYYDYELDSYVDGGMVQRTYAYGYMAFPQTLDEGYYLLEISVRDPITGETDITQKPLQVNNTSVYINTLNGQAIAWLNDAAGGEPLAGAEIRLLDSTGSRRLSSAAAGSDGTALWEHGAEEETSLIQIARTDGGPDYLDLLAAAPKQQPDARQLYVSFSSTDRGAYMTSDTIHIWGVVRGRRQPLPQGLSLRLEMDRGYDYYYGYYDQQEKEEPLFIREVSLNGDGSFSAELTFDNLVSGYHTIRLLDNEDRVVESQSFLIADYVKPKYTTSAWSDKAFYLPGEAVDMNLRVAYYDGTPVYGVPYVMNFPSGYYEGEPAPVYYTPREPEEEDDDMEDIPEADPYEGHPNDSPASKTYTNESGVIRAETAPPFRGDWFPAKFNYYFESTGDYFYDYSFGSALYFPSDLIFLTALRHSANGKAEIHISANRLDTSGISGADDIYTEDYPANITGEGVDSTVSVTIYKNTYHSDREMAVIAAGYDWASKQTLYQLDPNYYCWVQKEVLDSYDRVAAGGKLIITDLPEESDDRNITYCAVISVRDSLGNLQEDVIYLYPDFYPYFEEDSQEGNSSPEEPEIQLGNRVRYRFADTQYFSESGYVPSDISLKSGKTIGISLIEGREEINSGRTHYTTLEKGRFLYYLAEDGIGRHEVSERFQFSVEMRDEYMPSVTLLGAYFDGNHVYPVERGLELTYNYEDQELNVQLTADKERYGPGEEVNLTAVVSDAAGKGIRSRLSIGVVDEAAFAVAGQNINPLYALYSNYRYSSGYGSYTSYRQHADYYDYIQYRSESDYEPDYADEDSDDMENPVSGGGGDSGEDYVRSEFMDTARFLVLETDENGNAQARFALPDNLTSWRVTGAAIARDSLMAGTNVINLTATVDMFVNVLYNDSYLTGDNVGISLTAQGRALQGSTPIRYYVEIINAATGKTVAQEERKGRSDYPVHVSFGQLPMGNYSLTVRGVTNEGSDKLSYPFAVVSSNLELPVVRGLQLDNSGEPLDIHPARYPVLIGFSDERYGNYLNAAFYLVNRYGNRLDAMAAGVGARQFLEWYLPEEYSDYLDDIPITYANMNIVSHWSGLYSLYEYDRGDLELTARILALGGTETPYSYGCVSQLEEYAKFADPEEDAPPDIQSADPEWEEDPIDDEPAEDTGSDWSASPDEKAAALMGLAALNRPVLLELQQRLQEPELFTLSGQMYLVSGLALLGDYETALEFYEAHISPQLQTMGSYKRMPSQGDDEGYVHTARALMTASLLNHEDAQGLAAYLLDNRSSYYEPVTELALYLKTYQPAGNETASFQYNKNGKIQKVELKPGEIHYARFMKEDLENGGIKADSGNVTAAISYMGGVEDFALAYPEKENMAPDELPLKVEREIHRTTMEDLALFESYSYNIKKEEDLKGLYTVTLKVTLDKTAPAGRYTFHDRVPSSLRAGYETTVLRNGVKDTYYYWQYDFDKQARNISFYRYHESTFDQMNPPGETIEIVYIGQQLYTGESQMEPMLIQHSESSLSVLVTPEVSGSLASEAEMTKRAYPVKYISGGSPMTEENSHA